MTLRLTWMTDFPAKSRVASESSVEIRLPLSSLGISSSESRRSDDRQDLNRSIREVHEAIVKRDRPAYTTVQTMIYRLETKGAVRRTKKIGNAHVFEATTSRASVQTRLLKELLGLFDGSARPVMAHLVEMGKISREDIEDAQKLLREHNARDPSGKDKLK